MPTPTPKIVKLVRNRRLRKTCCQPIASIIHIFQRFCNVWNGGYFVGALFAMSADGCPLYHLPSFRHTTVGEWVDIGLWATIKWCVTICVQIKYDIHHFISWFRIKVTRWFSPTISWVVSQRPRIATRCCSPPKVLVAVYPTAPSLNFQNASSFVANISESRQKFEQTILSITEDQVLG